MEAGMERHQARFGGVDGDRDRGRRANLLFAHQPVRRLRQSLSGGGGGDTVFGSSRTIAVKVKCSAKLLFSRYNSIFIKVLENTSVEDGFDESACCARVCRKNKPPSPKIYEPNRGGRPAFLGFPLSGLPCGNPSSE